jgi:hypothetical protein
MEVNMKKIIGITALLLAVNLSFLYGQERERKYSVQANPWMLLVDIFTGAGDQQYYSYHLSFEFQYAINNYWNIVARPNFLSTNLLGDMGAFFSGAHKTNKNNANNGETVLFTLMPGILCRPFGTGLSGMYIGLYPNLGWENRKYEYGDNNSKAASIDDNFIIAGIGLEAGYEWIFGNGFSITIGGGLERNWGIEFEDNTGDYEEAKSLYKIRIAFFLGYSF